MAINCALANFRVNVDQPLAVQNIIQLDARFLTVDMLSVDAANEFYALVVNGYFFWVRATSGDLIRAKYTALSIAGTTISLETIDPNVALTSEVLPLSLLDKYLTNGTCLYSYPKTYFASVDEITDLRIRGEGRLDNRTIDIEGRWIGEAPKTLPKGRYAASMLADGGEWVDGTYKHIPRIRSRFGLETYFGSPLLGVFDFDRLIEPNALQPLDSQAVSLGVTLPRGLL
jgi:hypothetical protein